MKSAGVTGGLDLAGLRIGAAQAFGAVRLVPLLKDHVRDDLRLWSRSYGDDRPDVVGLRGDARAPELGYFAYIPHAYVLEWSSDGSARASPSPCSRSSRCSTADRTAATRSRGPHDAPARDDSVSRSAFSTSVVIRSSTGRTSFTRSGRSVGRSSGCASHRA